MSVRWAKELYGVECDPSGFSDMEGTARMKTVIRRERVRLSTHDAASDAASSYPAFVGDVSDIERKLKSEIPVKCRGCGTHLSHRSFYSISWASVTPYCGVLATDGLFELAGWFCDSCLKLDRVICYPRAGDSQ